MPDPTIPQLFDLSGRVALLTGATGHLGTAFAAALAEAGATVVASSREAAKSKAVAARLPSPTGARHFAVNLDHMDPACAERGFKDAVAAAGRVDILVNNGHEALGKDLTAVTPEEFSRHLVNATGYFQLARLLRDHVVARRGASSAPTKPSVGAIDNGNSRAGGGASVIMIGSMYGVVGSYPDAYAGVTTASPVAYHCLKGGIVHMTRHLAAYWARDGVRVNCLSPGPFPKPEFSGEVVNRLQSKSPMGRMGEPWELKGALVFLASDASGYVTGHNLLIDGGWTAW